MSECELQNNDPRNAQESPSACPTTLVLAIQAKFPGDRHRTFVTELDKLMTRVIYAAPEVKVGVFFHDSNGHGIVELLRWYCADKHDPTNVEVHALYTAFVAAYRKNRGFAGEGLDRRAVIGNDSHEHNQESVE